MTVSKEDDIKFYKLKDKFGIFSNFWRQTFTVDGKVYKTSEHYYQSKKFLDNGDEMEVVDAATPREAANLGRTKGKSFRPDWEEVKDGVMEEAVIARCEQSNFFRDKLLCTGDRVLIEDSPIDYYWGCGAKGTGRNQLGKTLMKVREIYRNAK